MGHALLAAVARPPLPPPPRVDKGGYRVKQQTSAAEYTEHNAKLYDTGGCEVLLADGQNAVLSCHITYQLPATSALMQPKQWKIHAHKIEGVAEHTGFWDKTDPYVKVMVVKNEYKTKVCPTTGRAEVKSGGGKEEAMQPTLPLAEYYRDEDRALHTERKQALAPGYHAHHTSAQGCVTGGGVRLVLLALMAHPKSRHILEKAICALTLLLAGCGQSMADFQEADGMSLL
jgi:hypothetical protein